MERKVELMLKKSQSAIVNALLTNYLLKEINSKKV